MSIDSGRRRSAANAGSVILKCSALAFSALTLLVGRQEGHPPVKNEWWGAGVVICLELGADLHMVQLMPLPLTLSCFGKIQIGFTFLILAHRPIRVVPEKGPLNGCVCVRARAEDGSEWLLCINRVK